MNGPDYAAIHAGLIEWRHRVIGLSFDETGRAVVVPVRWPLVVESLGVSIVLREPLSRLERVVRWLARRLPWWLPGARRVRARAIEALARRYGGAQLAFHFGKTLFGVPLIRFEPGYTHELFPAPILLQEDDPPLYVQMLGDFSGVAFLVTVHGLAPSEPAPR